MWSSSRYTRALIAAATAVASVGAAMAAEDLTALRVDPQRGQSADQLRRDRYECHNWAVEQTGQTPVAPSEERVEPSDAKRNKRAERADRALIGAAIGSVVGSIASSGRRHDYGDSVLAGAAVGAGVGAATAGKSRDKDKTESAPQPSEYLRALSACLEGRGYTVTMPSPPSAPTRR